MNRNKKTEKSVKKSHIFGTIFYLFSWLLNFNSLFKSTNKKKKQKKKTT